MRANIAKFHDMTKFMGRFISVQHKYAALKGQPANAILRIIFVKLLLWCFRTKQDLTATPEDETVPKSMPRHVNIMGKDYYN